MAPDADRLIALAEAVADGRPLNWPDVESDTRDLEDRALVRQLRFLAGVAEAHRSAGGAPPAEPPQPVQEAPRHWGKLEVLDRLGTGAFGSVYRAWDPRLAREVALKLMHAERLDDRLAPTVVEEGCLLARVHHPHVIAVYGADRFDGQVGIWMELIRGLTLEEVLQRQGPFSAREATSIGQDLCAALAAVHGAGLVHRDVKTHNVMREEGGRIVLMDFGAGDDAAALTGPRGLAGTPVCMAPELFAGAAATPQSDLYSLGVLLFRIVTGRYPVAARTADDVRQAHAEANRLRLIDLRADLPAAFVQVVERALAPRPEQRYRSAGEMQAALADVFRSDQATPIEPVRPWRLPRIQRALLAGGLLATALAVFAASAPGRAWLARFIPQTSVDSIAVLPFGNLSGDPAHDYFVAGVSEILIGRLGMIDSLRVISQSSVTAIPEAQRDPSTLRDRLGASYLVEGSVHRSEDRLRLTVRLIEASSGALRWTETIERPLGDLFALQGEVATAIGTSLGSQLSGDTRQRIQSRQTTSVEAQDAYLKGRHLLYTFNRANLAGARTFFEHAVALDPSYAAAHASLARVYVFMLDAEVPSELPLRSLAAAAADRAVNLNEGLPEAHVAQAETRFRLGRDWDAADAAFRRAVEIAPHASQVLAPYARFLAAAGRLDEALACARDGEAADPLSAETIASVAITHYYRREHDEAISQFTRAVEIAPGYGPGYFGLARVHSALGDYRQATEYIGKAVDLLGDHPAYRAELARNYAAAGWRNLAEQTLGGLLMPPQNDGHLSRVGIGYVYAALGDTDRAFEWLHRAVDDDDFTRVLFILVDPRADPLRSDPRFAALVRRLGLEP